MPVFEFVFGLLFVASSGLWFNARHRDSRFLVAIAGAIAIISTVTLVYSLWPSLQKLLSSPTDLSRSAVATDASPDGTTSNAMTTDKIPDKDPNAPHCEKSEDIISCVNRLSPSITVRGATHVAYIAATKQAILDKKVQLAITYLNTAIDNMPTNANPMIFLQRGMLLISEKQYKLALDDCERVDNGTDRGLLASYVSGDGENAIGPMVDSCMGQSLSGLGRHREALPYLDKAIEGQKSDGQGIMLYAARSASRSAVGDTVGADADSNVFWAYVNHEGEKTAAAKTSGTHLVKN